MEDTAKTTKRRPSNSKPLNNQEETDCPWFIDSPEHHNCFWLYVKTKSAPDGSMPELVQTEIAKLVGWSNTKTHFVLKQAMEELEKALKALDPKSPDTEE